MTWSTLPDHLRAREHGKAAAPQKRKPAHTPGKMNSTEAWYGQLLELRKRAGEIVEYKFEAVKLRLADGCWYTPDFAVWTRDGLEMHEVKGGFVRDDALVKFKVAAEAFPMFVFRMMKCERKSATAREVRVLNHRYGLNKWPVPR